MQDIIIIGAGAFGREVNWLIERINRSEPKWNVIGFVDDGIVTGEVVAGLPVFGGIDYLLSLNEQVNLVCAIAGVNARKQIIANLNEKDNVNFPNLIDPSVIQSPSVQMGCGNIICASSVLSVDIKIEDFVIIDWNCTIGHDVVLGSYVTVYPGTNISGCVDIGIRCEIGTGTKVVQGLKIASDVVTGAGAVVAKDIDVRGTYVGVPVKMVK